MRSAQSADRRLVVAGFRPIEAVLPRLAVLATATVVVLVVSLAVTALSFTPALLAGLHRRQPARRTHLRLHRRPRRRRARPTRATYLVLFLAMLGIGILQNPMFGDGTPGGLADAFPDYGAGRVIIDGAFSAGFHAWSELALALGWLAVLGLAVTWVLRRLLRSAA